MCQRNNESLFYAETDNTFKRFSGSDHAVLFHDVFFKETVCKQIM